MLTGQKPFVGDDVSDTLAAVLRTDVNLDALPDGTPATLRRVISACLRRDPKQRVHDVADVRLAMEGAFETTVTTPSEAGVAQPPQFWQRPVSVLSVLVIAVLASGLAVWTVMRPAIIVPDLMRFVISPPETAPLTFTSAWQDVVISPDGAQVVYTSGTADAPQLHLRPIDQVAGAPLRGGAGGGPFVSPDGEWVGFHSGTGPLAATLQKVSMFGGSPVTVAESPSPIFGASWGADDQIIFGTLGRGLFRVSGGGGL